MPRNWTRRQLLIGGGSTVVGLGALGGAGAIGYAWPRSSAPAASPSPSPTGTPDATQAAAQAASEVHSFLSRSDLQPPRLTVDVYGSPAGVPQYIFLANKPYRGPSPTGQRGLIIAQRNGEITWFNPIDKGQVLDFNVQAYKGKPVLTWWHGETGKTFGHGTCYVADSSYNVIAKIEHANGLQPDMHEFNVTPQGTALIDFYKQVNNVDLTALHGGKAKGAVWTGIVQEIDIATGQVIFEWSSIDHVPPTETVVKLSGSGTTENPFDYFHINSIGTTPDGNLLVSSRNTSTVYKVSRKTGKILWRIGGGQKSDFAMGPGTKFYYQHHVRMHGTDIMTVFDDAAGPPQMEPQSRGIILKLDTANMRASLVQAFTNPEKLVAPNQGSMQLLPGNRAFVGWGAEPYFNEFDANGAMLLNGRMPINDQSYRAFTGAWVGHPTEPPAIAINSNPPQGSAVYASWNGATEVATWRVHAGKKESTLAVVATAPKSGFETVIVANSTGPYFMVSAHDASGKQIGQSKTVRSS